MENQHNQFVKRELATPSPRARLIPVTAVFQAVSDLTDGTASIPEICGALYRRYDPETMMLYRGIGSGLADAIDGLEGDEFSGYNKRSDIECEFGNSRYWENPDATFPIYGEKYSVHEILMTKKDGLILAQKLWQFFEPDSVFDLDRYLVLTDQKTTKISLNDPPVQPSDQRQKIEIDPTDLPPELDAAMLAFRAVSNGYGTPSATFRNRLIDYLQATYPSFKTEQVQRIATVANADPTPGRKNSTQNR